MPSKSKNTSPASTAEVRAWAAKHVAALEKAKVSTTFLNPPSGLVRGRIPAAVGEMFTKATGRPYAEKKGVVAPKNITLTLTKRDKNGRSRGHVDLDVPVAQVRTLGGAPERGRISSAVREKAIAALEAERGWQAQA